MRCPRCRHGNSESARYCNECGSELSPEIARAAGFRGARPYTPRHLAEAVLRSQAALEGERKLVTVLFVDIQSSLSMARDLDPEDWHRVLDRFFRRLAEAVHRFEGTINQYTGDGIMALFGAPVAHEDHAQRACHCALEIRDAMGDFDREVREQYGAPFAVRQGLNAGEVVVGRIGDDLRMDYTAQGQCVGIAARLQGLATGGGILLGPGVADLVSGFFELEALGPKEVRGLDEPIFVHALLGRGRLQTRLELEALRGLSAFVGRRESLASLDKGFERAASGEGIALAVEGAPGVGKSRLCREFVARKRARDVPVFEVHCPAHGRLLPGQAARALLRELWALGSVDDPDRLRERLGSCSAPAEQQEALRDALGLGRADPDFAALTREGPLLAAAAVDRSRTTLVFIDDAQWLDGPSERFLERLLGESRDLPLLVLASFRPEYRAAWTDSPQMYRLGLGAMGKASSGALVAALVGDREETRALREWLVLQADGTPLFVEELVRSLVETGVLVGEEGDFRVQGNWPEIAVPGRVQPLIAARIDRLEDREKRLLQIAAVMGTSFEESIVGPLSGLAPDDLGRALRRLEDSDFVRAGSLYSRTPWRFIHALTREVAYAGLLREDRERLHRAVAVAIEERGERLGEYAGLIAAQWEAAGRKGEARRWRNRASFQVRNLQPRRRQH